MTSHRSPSGMSSLAEFQVIAATAQQFLDEFEAGAPALEVTAPADLSRDI